MSDMQNIIDTFNDIAAAANACGMQVGKVKRCRACTELFEVRVDHSGKESPLEYCSDRCIGAPDYYVEKAKGAAFSPGSTVCFICGASKGSKEICLTCF